MPTDERRRVLKVFVVAGNRITLLTSWTNIFSASQKSQFVLGDFASGLAYALTRTPGLRRGDKRERGARFVIPGPTLTLEP